MVKSKFLQITSILMIVFSTVFIFVSLILFIILLLGSSHNFSYYSSSSYHSISIPYLFYPSVAIAGCVVNIVSAIVGIAGGIYGLKNWDNQESAGRSAAVAIVFIILTLIGFVLLFAGIFPLFALWFFWLIFQMIAPIFHLAGACMFKIGKPIRTSSQYVNPPYYNYNGYYPPNGGFDNSKNFNSYNGGDFQPNGYDRNEYYNPGYNNYSGYNPNVGYADNQNPNCGNQQNDFTGPSEGTSAPDNTNSSSGEDK